MPFYFSKKLLSSVILHSCVLIFFFFISFAINKIPEKTIVAGGDFYQLINISDNLDRYLFTWFNQIGQGQYNPLFVAFPFYLIQAFLFKIGFSYTNIANSVMFLFLIGSFYSFYFAIRLINVEIPRNIRLLGSAIYAVNIFTFTIFTYSWWITHHFIIYLFIPLLFASFDKLIISFSKKDIAQYSILFLISTMGFNNIAYFVALLFIQALLFVAYFITKRIPFSINSIGRISFIVIWQIILSIFYLLPFLSSQFEYRSNVVGGNVLGDFYNWLSYTSTKAYGIFSFTMVEDKYPIFNIYSDTNLLLGISIGYTFILILALLYKKDEYRHHWFHYLLFFIPYWFLLMRLTPPFDGFNRIIYSLPGFNLFRSPEKLFVFYPFFFLALLSLLLFYGKLPRITISVLLVLILLIPIPFFIRGIPAYLAQGDQIGNKYTVQIPSDYQDMADEINEDFRQLSIVSLPYSVVNSINWSNYPKWEFSGFDVQHLLFKKLYISANVYDHVGLENNLSFKEYNETNEVNKDEFLKLLQKFSGQYILLHKDISIYWLDNSETIFNTIKELESDNTLLKLDSNEYFTLYELDEDNLVPLISSDGNGLSFQKINLTKYRINLKNITKKTHIRFHQSFNSQWKLYLVPNPNDSWCRSSHYYEIMNVTECEITNKMIEVSDLGYILDKPIFDDVHSIVNDYSNGWIIDPGFVEGNYPSDYYKENQNGDLEIEMVLYFKPQSYFILGLIVSSIVFIGCSGYLVWSSKR